MLCKLKVQKVMYILTQLYEQPCYSVFVNPSEQIFVCVLPEWENKTGSLTADIAFPYKLTSDSEFHFQQKWINSFNLNKLKGQHLMTIHIHVQHFIALPNLHSHILIRELLLSTFTHAYYVLITNRPAGPKITLPFPRLYIYIYIYIYMCVRTYHVRNNYVTYIVAMRPYSLL